MDRVLARILAWAEAHEAVRLVVLTSTRARGDDDALSDYDLIVALTDLEAFDPAGAYRMPAARWGDEHEVHGTTTYFRGVVYDDGVKVDWTLWPAGVPELVASHGLTDDLDVGYRVLLDKDGATSRWAEPTFRAHIPAPPTEAEYVALVEEFWWSATYVAKARARGERFFERFVLEIDLTHGVLRRMLEWRIETERGWSWKPGAYGRGIERELPADLTAEIAGAEGSFERTVALFRRVAGEVGEKLGYAYPQLADDAVTAYVDKLQSAGSASFDPQPTLIGDLLEVRPLRADDEEALLAAASDPLIWEQHPVPDRYVEANFRPYFRELLASGGAVAVVDRATGGVIGVSRYHGYDEARSEVEIGWTFLARPYWGGTYNAELKRLMLGHAFRFVRTVVFLVHPDNVRSSRAVEKIGGRRVGMRPDAYGRESLVYAITRA